jgi:nucleoside-diphosphate-sugar epimerase
MKVLFIGGTGIISTAVSHLAVERGIDLTLLNRGQRPISIPGAEVVTADAYRPDEVRAALQGRQFDAVVDWIAFTEPDIERDIALFRDMTRQFIFISSASAYQKPVTHPIITESTPLYNPYWEYSRNKIRCEDRLMRAYREEGFPVTIVRPSHTYDKSFPAAIGGGTSYTLVDRLLNGRPIIVHGDGTSLWTLTHSEDFAKAFVGLLGNPRAIGHAFHITSDEALTWNQITKTLAAAVGVEANIVHIASDFIVKVMPDRYGSLLGDKSWSVMFDNTRIKTFVPEYVATIPFHTGIRRTLAWYAEDASRRTVDADLNAQIDRVIDAYAGALNG